MDGRVLVLGDTTASRPAGQMIFSRFEWKRIERAYGLSDRESQVLRSVFDDHKESVIANRLQISNHTVHTYLGRLYRKFRVRSRCELIVTVCSHHLRTSGPSRLKSV
jgi:DNA-binding CsgD family transcriptional regulator